MQRFGQCRSRLLPVVSKRDNGNTGMGKEFCFWHGAAIYQTKNCASSFGWNWRRKCLPYQQSAGAQEFRRMQQDELVVILLIGEATSGIR